MPVSFSDDDLADPHAAAAANLASSHGISPAEAVGAIKAAPDANMPPALGMYTSAQVQAAAQDRQREAAIGSSPAVANWAATGDPAYVAASKDDFPGLAKVATAVGNYAATVGGHGPIHDFATAFVGGLGTLGKDLAAVGAAPKGLLDFQGPLSVGKSLFDAVALVPSSLYATGTEPFARAIAPLVTVSAPINPLEQPRQLNTPEERLNEARSIVGLSMFGLGPARRGPRPIDIGTLRDVTPRIDPNVPRLPAPGTHPPTDAFRQGVAEFDAAHVAEVQAQVAATQTHARSPEVMERFIEHQTPGRTVEVDPDTLLALAEQGHEPFPEHADDIRTAAQTGEPVEVPYSRYVARTAGEPFAGELNSTTNFREGGVSVAEGQELPVAEQPSIAASEPTPPADLTPDEHPAFRTYAADANNAVDRVVADLRLHELFSEAKAVGATKSNFERYSTSIEEQIATARDRMVERAAAQIRRERKPDWQAALAQHSAAAEQELASRPDIIARAYLTQGKSPLGAPVETPFKLDRSDPIVQYGRDLGLPDRMFSKSGLSADEAAEVFGFRSGADMVRALADLHAAQADLAIPQHMKALIREIATARTRSELGFDLDPEAIHQAASEAIATPQLTDLLADDLKSWADEHGLPFDKDAMKQFAANRFASRPVKQATNIRRLEEFLNKDSRKLETALLKSDIPAAFRWKQAQFLHQLELVQAHKFLKVHARAERLFKRVANKVSLPSVSQDALNWAKDILATTGRQVKGNTADLERPIGGYNHLAEYVLAKNAEGGDIPLVNVPRTDLADTSVAQYTDIANMVRAIMERGKAENEVEVAGRKLALSDALDQGISTLDRYSTNITEQELNYPNLVQALQAARRAGDAWLVRLEQLMQDFSGGDLNSPFFQIGVRRLQERKAWNMDQRVALAGHFRELAKSAGPKFDKWLAARLPTDPALATVTYPDGSPVFVTHRDIMMAALHMGDEGAMDAFTSGFDTDPATVEAIVHAYSTPEMWKAVQGIWKAFEKLTPEIVRQYKARNGVTPLMVEPREVKLPDGTTLPGGYFPIRRDPTKMPKQWIEQQAGLGNMLGTPHYQRALPANAYIKQRTGAVSPVEMSFDGIYSRLNQTIHDLAYRDVLADMNKFLLHPRMRDAITRKYGPEYVNKLRADIQDIAASESVNPIDRQIGKALDYLSEGQMVNMIGFSPSTMLKHGLTAQAQALAEVGLPRYASWLAKVRLNPGKWNRLAQAESADVRHILSTFNEDSFRQFLAISRGKTKLSNAALSFAFHMVGYSNHLVAVPLYHAAKEMIAEANPGMDEATVRAGAGHAVRQALGSAGITESPMVMRLGSGVAGRFMRITNPFMTFLNHMYNKQREIPQAFGYAGEKPNFGRGAALLLTAVILPIFIDQAIARKALDEAGTFKFWAEGLIHHLTGGIPILNSVAAAAVNKIDKAEPASDTLFSRIGENIGTFIHNAYQVGVQKHAITRRMVDNALILGGQALKAPGLEAARLNQFFAKLHAGRESDWQTVLHDLTIGPNPKTVPK